MSGHERWAAYEREPCITCGACVGVSCQTRAGKRSAVPHNERILTQFMKEGRLVSLPRGGYIERVG